MNTKMELYTPKVSAAERGQGEFDPETEAHHFGFLVKLVDPGCTIELQIEERNGRVTRLTSTEDTASDRHDFIVAIVAAANRLFDQWSI